MISAQTNIRNKSVLILIFLFFCVSLQAQKKEYWLIDVQTNKNIVVQDSLSAVKFLDSLAQNNYFFTQVKNVVKAADTTKIYFNKGKNYNEAIVIPEQTISEALKLKKEFHTKNLDSLKKTISENFSKQGFIFNRVQSKFKGLRKDIPVVELSVLKNKQRTIDQFVVKGYDKIPKRFIKNLEKDFLNKNYQANTILRLNQTLQNNPYFRLEKPAQTLFTKDSTQIFLFLEKKKSNSFDGILGFGNDKTDKLTFNGSLNLNFRNMFNSFETVNIFWQRNPDKAQTFDVQTDVPYLFKSNIGGNLNINIFRQDSTFANVKLNPALYLHLNSNQKLGIRGVLETSAVLDSLYVQGRDYNKNGVGLWYEYAELSEIPLFINKSRVKFQADYLTTNYAEVEKSNNETHFYLSGERNFQLKGNHYLNLNIEGALLNSKNNFAVNELLRFGGWNSFRGFNENSLLADYYYFGTAEYRYLVGEQAFFDIFTQYGKFNNKTLEVKPQIYSVGFGFNFFLPVGLMSFQISNGNTFGDPFKFNSTKIHWGLLSRF